jgi:hypothetical protein
MTCVKPFGILIEGQGEGERQDRVIAIDLVIGKTKNLTSEARRHGQEPKTESKDPYRLKTTDRDLLLRSRLKLIGC